MVTLTGGNFPCGFRGCVCVYNAFSLAHDGRLPPIFPPALASALLNNSVPVLALRRHGNRPLCSSAAFETRHPDDCRLARVRERHSAEEASVCVFVFFDLHTTSFSHFPPCSYVHHPPFSPPLLNAPISASLIRCYMSMFFWLDRNSAPSRVIG